MSMDDTNYKLNDIKKKALYQFLIERKGELTRKLESNQDSIDNELKKLNAESEEFTNEDAMKVTKKISECERNVNFFSHEIVEVNKAKRDIECGISDTKAVSRAYANLEMSNIKREMNKILGWAVVIYLVISISLVLFNKLINNTENTSSLFEMFYIVSNLTLTVGMLLISIALVSIYDQKCENYNSVVEKIDVNLKITDSTMKDNKPGIFKWYALITLLIFIAQYLITLIGEVLIVKF